MVPQSSSAPEIVPQSSASSSRVRSGSGQFHLPSRISNSGGGASRAPLTQLHFRPSPQRKPTVETLSDASPGIQRQPSFATRGRLLLVLGFETEHKLT